MISSQVGTDARLRRLRGLGVVCSSGPLTKASCSGSADACSACAAAWAGFGLGVAGLWVALARGVAALGWAPARESGAAADSGGVAAD